MPGAKNPLHRNDASSSRTPVANEVPSYKKGGRVKKTGLARVHKGEMVIPVRKGKPEKPARPKQPRKPMKARRAKKAHSAKRARRSGR